MDKMAALQQIFSDRRMLVGTTASFMASNIILEAQKEMSCSLDVASEEEQEDDDDDDGGPGQGDLTPALFVVNLAAKFRVYTSIIAL